MGRRCFAPPSSPPRLPLIWRAAARAPCDNAACRAAQTTLSSLRMFELKADALERAIALFGAGNLGAPHSLTISFGSLGPQVEMRAHAIQQARSTAVLPRDSGRVARLLQYSCFRFRELLMRLQFLNWLQHQCESAEEFYSPWHNFAALTIKDFHIDLGSLMDSIAPAVLQASGAIDIALEERKFPGFADLLADSGSRRAPGFRESIDSAVLEAIDSTTRWWPSVKLVRDDLAHREHTKIVFGEARQGIFFQLYMPGFAPKIIDKRLLWPEAANVADFRLYSAAIFGELLTFLEELGTALAATLRLRTKGVPSTIYVGDYSFLLEPMEQLLQAVALGERPKE